MEINDFQKKLIDIKIKYEDRLTDLRYSLLLDPSDSDKVVEFLEVMNNASTDVIGFMQEVLSIDTQEDKTQCMDMLYENLPEYFYFLEIEENFHRRGLSDPPHK